MVVLWWGVGFGVLVWGWFWFMAVARRQFLDLHRQGGGVWVVVGLRHERCASVVVVIAVIVAVVGLGLGLVVHVVCSHDAAGQPGVRYRVFAPCAVFA